jgi:membrane protein required for colicin V production
MTLAPLDWVLLAILLISALVGVWRGLIYEVLSLVAWGVAFFVAQVFAADMGALLPMGSAGEGTRYLAGFAVVFLLALVVCGLTIALLTKLISAVGLRPIDRVLGGLFGLIRGLLLLVALVLIVGITPLHKHAEWQASGGVHTLQNFYKAVQPLLPVELARYLPE